MLVCCLCWFVCNETPTPEITTYHHTLPLHDALPSCLDAIIAAVVEGLSATVGDDPGPAGDRARAADRARGFVLSGDAQDVAVALIAPLRPRVGNGIGALARRDRKSTRLNSSH